MVFIVVQKVVKIKFSSFLEFLFPVIDVVGRGTLTRVPRQATFLQYFWVLNPYKFGCNKRIQKRVSQRIHYRALYTCRSPFNIPIFPIRYNFSHGYCRRRNDVEERGWNFCSTPIPPRNTISAASFKRGAAARSYLIS